MSDALTLDQKIEILKLAHLEATIDTDEAFRKFMALLTEDRCRKCRDSLKNVVSEVLDSHGSERVRPPLRLTAFLDECYSPLKDEDGQTITLLLTRYKHGYYTFKHHDNCFSCRDDELEGICGNRMRLQRNDGTIKNQDGETVTALYQSSSEF